MSELVSVDSPSTDVAFPPAFEPLFKPKRYKVAPGGRGGGRSWSFARALLILASKYKLRILCAREFQGSIAESVHKLLATQIEKLGLQEWYIIEKASIRSKNGSEFFFEGIKYNSQKIKSYEAIDICWVEEAQAVSKSSWEILIPTIRKDNYPPEHFLKCSEIWVSFNPDLETDDTYQRFMKSPYKNQVTMFTTWRDNPFFPEILMEEMEELKAKDYDTYLWVWEGQCRTLVEGAVYGEEIKEASTENRLTAVSYTPGKPVTTYWDLGRRGMTSIIFTQTIGPNEYVIRTYENRNKDLDHYWKKMQEFNYYYGYCVLPHDAKAHKLGMKSSIKRQFEEAGFQAKIVPKLTIAEGIEHTRGLWSKLWFDVDKCEDFLHAARHYRYEIVESEISGKKVFSKEPVKDGWTDHYCDALRMKACAHVLWPEHSTKFSFNAAVENTTIQRYIQEQTSHALPGRGSRADGWMGR